MNLQHSSAYSMPAIEKPELLHAWIHKVILIAVEPPVTGVKVVSARPLVPSL
jgi:hypothetical protein